MVNLLQDEQEAREFIKRLLLRLEDDEVNLLFLHARKKWCELSRSEEVLEREMVKYNDEDKILRKIKKVGVVGDGIYVDRNTLKEIPINCLGMYCLLDPRSTLKGYAAFQSDINKWIYESFKGVPNLEYYRKMDIKLFSAIHKNRSRILYYTVDIDTKDEVLLDKTVKLLEGYIRWISSTHGGYHIIVDRNNETGRIIYMQIRKIEKIEILNDSVTPVPGTLQGGILVKGIRKDLWN